MIRWNVYKTPVFIYLDVHKGENLAKQHGCLLCSETFIESQDLILHMESAHKKSIKNNAGMDKDVYNDFKFS